MDIKRLLNAATAVSDSHRPTIIIVNVSAQSLAVHALLLRVDLLVITETCSDAVSPVNVNNLLLVRQLPYERCAGGVAV